MTHTISAHALWSAAQFVSTDPTRHWISGVSVEPREGGGALLIATDGQALVCIEDTSAEVSRKLLIGVNKPAMAALKHKSSSVATYDDAGMLTVNDHNGTATYIAPDGAWVDGAFPDWRKIMASGDKPDDKAALIDPALLMRFEALYGRPCDRKRGEACALYLKLNGTSPILVTTDLPGLFGMMMPMLHKKQQPAYASFAEALASVAAS